MRVLSPFTDLSSLDLAHCTLSNDGLRVLSPLTALTSLNLSCFRWVSDEGLRTLSPLKALTHLDLTSCERLATVMGSG
jgi:hypothetical protein